MFQFLTKYNQGDLWIERFKAREEKKQVFLAPVEVQTQVEHTEESCIPQVVFTREDSGHTGAEAQKIQELYHDLDDAPRMPVYAFA